MSYANALDIKLLNVSTSKERNSITNHNNNGINKQKSTPCILSHVHAHPKKKSCTVWQEQQTFSYLKNN